MRVPRSAVAGARPAAAAEILALRGEDGGGLSRSYLRPCLLLCLAEGPSHGYELLEEIQDLGVHGAEPGGLYRALRSMEREGLVRSWWERSQAGPARRTYILTDVGRNQLDVAGTTLRTVRLLLDTVLDRYAALGQRTETSA